MKAFFENVLELGVDFKTQSTVNPNYPSIPAAKSFGRIPDRGLSNEQLLVEFRNLAQASSNWASPNFMGFPDAGNSTPGLGAAMLIPFLNQNLANQDICAPTATFIEMEVVHWLRSQLGFPTATECKAASEIGGILTLGGCLSNTIALMAAWEKLFPGSGIEGLLVLAKIVRVLVPDVIEHYSIRSAMSWLSLGEANVVRVPVDDEFRIRLPSLEKIIDEERAKGRYILACVAIKSQEYLRSPEMLARLVFNILTTSSVQIAGHLSSLSSLRSDAEAYLVSMIQDSIRECLPKSTLFDLLCRMGNAVVRTT